MKRRFAQRVLVNHEAAPTRIRKAFDKQSALLLSDLWQSVAASKEVQRGGRYLAGPSHQGLALLLQA